MTRLPSGFAASRQTSTFTFLVGLLIGFFASLIFAATTKNGTSLSYAACGVIAAFLIMLFKELMDFFRGEDFDAKDWLFGTIGGVLGALLWLV